MKIPIEWRNVRLEDVIVDMQPGFAQRPKDTKEGTPQLRTNNVSPEGNIDLSALAYVEASASDLEKYGVKRGDVIFNNTNSVEWVGKTACFDQDGDYVLSNHMTRLRVKEELLDAQFLARFLHYLWQAGHSHRWAKHWVNQAAIDQSTLAKFQIILPPLPEQRRIVAILRAADELRRLRREADEKAKQILPALFYEMFIENEKAKKWYEVPLSEMGQLDRGRSRHRPRDAAHLYGGSYPFVQTGDVANADGWVTSYSQTYSEAGLMQSKLWPKGTLCITIAANIARTAILSFDACFPDSIVGFIPRPGIYTEFVRQWLVTHQGRLESFAPQAAQKNINLEILRKLQIPCPPESQQARFAKAAIEMRGHSKQRKDSFLQFDNLFQSLLARAFTGELTQAWREKHTDELAAAAEQRDKLLGLARRVVSDRVEIKEARVTVSAEVVKRREQIMAALSRSQGKTLVGVEADPNYTVAETWIGPVAVQRALELLAAAGLILSIGLPVADDENRMIFVSTFRSRRDDDDAIADFSLAT